jgi:hypothetical protein
VPTLVKRSRLVVKNESDDGKDRLAWKWTQGESTSQTVSVTISHRCASPSRVPLASRDSALCMHTHAHHRPKPSIDG